MSQGDIVPAPALKILALADDATGALEVGARFCDAGIDARVRFEAKNTGSSAAIVIDTETRHLPAKEAYRQIRYLARNARGPGRTQIFLKTDSTLRGPIASGFRALLDAWPGLPLIYAPAYPALGRTVRDGELLVDGKPLSQTAFATDPLNPSREGSIPSLLRSIGAEIVTVRDSSGLRPSLAGGRILVCDGTTEDDLDAVAAAVYGIRCVVAGTAAFASSWAETISTWDAPAWARPSVRSCLVVNGSLHPGSHRQMAISGLPAISHDPSGDAWDLGTRLAALLDRHQWASLCASADRAGEPLLVANHAARSAAHALRLAQPDCLVVFGGDTLIAILRELGISHAQPRTEILPGVPVSTIYPVSPRAMLLVTKAGGFGPPDYLQRIREILERA